MYIESTKSEGSRCTQKPPGAYFKIDLRKLQGMQKTNVLWAVRKTYPSGSLFIIMKPNGILVSLRLILRRFLRSCIQDKSFHLLDDMGLHCLSRLFVT